MALIHCNFKSEVLDLQTAMYVILPQRHIPERTSGEEHSKPENKVLYLLHGHSDDYTTWLRNTSIERFAEPLDLAVIMPTVHNSFYTDMAHGGKYWTFISQELPELARSFFPLSDKREDTYVAGISMGGYGAFKLALSQPERFAAAASISGAMDIPAVSGIALPGWQEEMTNIFGDLDKVKGSQVDLFFLAELVAASKASKPRLYQWCGTGDFLHEMNTRFSDHAQRLGLDLVYSDGPGAHEWSSWDDQIQKVLRWIFPDKKRES